MTGSSEFEVEKKERSIKEMQTNSKVGMRSDLYFLAGGNESPRNNPISYPNQFVCKMDREMKKKFNPWKIKKCFTPAIGSEPVIVRSNGDSEFITENLMRKRKQRSSYNNRTELLKISRNS